MQISLEELKYTVVDPQWIVKEMDKHVIGQMQAKKILSLVVFNRALLLLQASGRLQTNVQLEKNNALLIGPSGTGKTALIHALEEVCDLPITIFDVSGITSSGYHGASIDDILLHYIDYTTSYVNHSFTKYGLVEDANLLPYMNYEDPSLINIYDKKTIMQQMRDFGIIYLDEIDKIRSMERTTLDIKGDCVQNELLKVIEGHAPIEVSEGRRRNNRTETLDTKNISFIAGGAFSGLEEIIVKRLAKNNQIGFTGNNINKEALSDEYMLSKVTTKDLIAYGLKPEFLGRIPIRAVLSNLDPDSMLRIIKEPENSVLSQYEEMFRVYNKKLIFEEDALKVLANRALDLDMGARSLRKLFSLVLTDELYYLYDNQDDEVVISADTVKERLKEDCDE